MRVHKFRVQLLNGSDIVKEAERDFISEDAAYKYAKSLIRGKSIRYSSIIHTLKATIVLHKNYTSARYDWDADEDKVFVGSTPVKTKKQPKEYFTQRDLLIASTQKLSCPQIDGTTTNPLMIIYKTLTIKKDKLDFSFVPKIVQTGDLKAYTYEVDKYPHKKLIVTTSRFDTEAEAKTAMLAHFNGYLRRRGF